MRSEFIEAIKTHQSAFSLDLAETAINRLADYFSLIQQHNEFLNLVGPSTPEVFATRHILESLTLLEYLPPNVWFADVGTGGGLPSIPCLLVRDDLTGVLIESKEKKSKFLNLAIEQLSLAGRTRVVTKQFQETEPAKCQFVTCRALDKFTEKLPSLIKWAGRREMLLFGGNNLKSALETHQVAFAQLLLPMSEQRFLFTTKPEIR